MPKRLLNTTWFYIHDGFGTKKDGSKISLYQDNGFTLSERKDLEFEKECFLRNLAERRELDNITYNTMYIMVDGVGCELYMDDNNECYCLANGEEKLRLCFPKKETRETL